MLLASQLPTKISKDAHSKQHPQSCQGIKKLLRS